MLYGRGQIRFSSHAVYGCLRCRLLSPVFTNIVINNATAISIVISSTTDLNVWYISIFLVMVVVEYALLLLILINAFRIIEFYMLVAIVVMFNTLYFLYVRPPHILR
jgi:hypothetical protein